MPMWPSLGHKEFAIGPRMDDATESEALFRR